MTNQAPVNMVTHLQIFQHLLSCCSASSCPGTRQCSGTVLAGSCPALYQHPQLWEGSCGFLSSQTHFLPFCTALALAALPHDHLSLQNVNEDQQALPHQQMVIAHCSLHWILLILLFKSVSLLGFAGALAEDNSIGFWRGNRQDHWPELL